MITGNPQSLSRVNDFADRILAPLIPALGCASLIGAAIIVAQKKHLWNDEILSLVLIQDPSFTHMLHAWGDTFNQAPPLYFISAWGWDKLFGSSDLSIRLLGSLCLCVALVVTWRSLRLIWGPFASGIGTVAVYCLSSLVLYHNTEARMYSLFVLTCSVGLYYYLALLTHERVSVATFVGNLLTQAAIVLTHLYGTFYSTGFLLSLIIVDWTSRQRLRPTVYASFIGGWTLLIPCLPGLINQANNHAHWFGKISLHTLATYYMAGSPFDRYLTMVIFISPSIYLARNLFAPDRLATPQSVMSGFYMKSAIIIVSCAFALVPILAWAITVTIKPMLTERNIIPTITVAWPVILSFGLWVLFFAHDEVAPGIRRSVAVALLAGPALAYPLWYAVKYPVEDPPGENDAGFGYLNLPVAMEAGHDYLPRMHYSNQPQRYFHIRDWDTAIKNTASGYATGDYTHMAAVNRHYPYVQSVESHEFLAKYNRFLVWNEPDQKWFEWRILNDPNYAVQLLGRDNGSTGPLELYLVEKKQH
jgi:hypothetical protein